MGACAEKNISLCYMTPQGKFLARVTGKTRGNVVLRKQQYESSNDDTIALEIAKSCILGKVHNARWVLERAIRDHAMQIDAECVKKASEMLKNSIAMVRNSTSKDELRGYEGEAASIYFGVFDELILQQKKDFTCQGRNRRTPMDKLNECNAVICLYIVDQYGDVCTGKRRTGSLCRLPSYRTARQSFFSTGYDGRTQGSSGRSVCVVVSE